MESEQVCTKLDVHSRVTDEIIRTIELGVSDCEMPWHGQTGAGFPRNPATGKVYQGLNTLALWATSRLRGYGLPYWATYRQWQSLGAQVRHGEHGSIIVFYKRDVSTSDELDEHEEQHRSKILLRYSTVFNSEQIQNWSRPVPEHKNEADALNLVDTFVKVLAADIQYGSNSAYYSPKFDRIYMPNLDAFVDTKAGCAAESFYSVLLHEHIHWSGHESRLKRDLSGRFGSNAYAMEELVAELGAAFLCATFGTSAQPREDHASFIANWLQVLKEYKSAIFVASNTASIACRYLETQFKRKNVAMG